MNAERKVKAATGATALSGAVLWLLSHYVFKSGVPDVVTSWVYVLAPAAAAYAAGYLTRHAPQELQELLRDIQQSPPPPAAGGPPRGMPGGGGGGGGGGPYGGGGGGGEYGSPGGSAVTPGTGGGGAASSGSAITPGSGGGSHASAMTVPLGYASPLYGSLRSPDAHAAPGGRWTILGWAGRDGDRHWFPVPVVIRARAVPVPAGRTTARLS